MHDPSCADTAPNMNLDLIFRGVVWTGPRHARVGLRTNEASGEIQRPRVVSLKPRRLQGC
jgi:hypothetical protein